MTKIYAQGNYLVIEANDERNTFPKKGVGFKIIDDGIYSLSSQELPIGDFNYSEIKKEDGSDYTTALEFETFLFENTGNFNSGADVSPNYIPLTGTEEGKPIIGNFQYSSEEGVIITTGSDGFRTFGNYVTNGNLSGYSEVDFYGAEIGYYDNEDGQVFLSIGNIGHNEGAILYDRKYKKGLKGEEDYSANLTPLHYTQRSYVERPETLINCLNNATPAQLSTIKSILGIV